MIENLTIFLNTTSNCRDLWRAFFGQLSKFWPDHPPIVVATDDLADFCGSQEPWTESLRNSPRADYFCRYRPGAAFGQQYLQGLSYVTTDYVLPMLEDFILIGDVDVGAIEEAVRLASLGPQHPVQLTNCIGRPYQAYPDRGRFAPFEGPFTMQPTVWPMHRLLYRCVQYRDKETPWDWELGYPSMANTHYVYGPIANGPKRGRLHFDSLIFPYVATALNKRKWNMSEYPDELGRLLKEYNIDPSVRGTA